MLKNGPKNKILHFLLLIFRLSIISFILTSCVSLSEYQTVKENHSSLKKLINQLQIKVNELNHELELIRNEDEKAKRLHELSEQLNKLKEQLADASIQIEKLQDHNQKLKSLNSDLEESKQDIEKSYNSLKDKIGELDNPLSKAVIFDWKLMQILEGSLVFAQNNDNTYLGVINFSGIHSESLFNEYGNYGSKFGLYSIWNDFSLYGSSIGLYSARNNLCINPPMIIKNNTIIGYLTTNDLYIHIPKYDPYYLKQLANYIQGKR